jgi:site-specific DNA recombinase
MKGDATGRVDPANMDDLRELVFAKFTELSVTSPEFGRWMKLIIPRLEVRPVRSLDGGTPRPRAVLALNLAPLVPIDVGTAASKVLRMDLTVDLFDGPQHVVHRDKIMELTSKRVNQREIAAQLGIHLATIQRAIALSRLMAENGTNNPYVLMSGPPSDYAKMRRHLHRRYRFDPLDGFGR